MTKYTGLNTVGSLWSKILARISQAINSVTAIIPTKVSDITNDAGYQNASQVMDMIAASGGSGQVRLLVEALPPIEDANMSATYFIRDSEDESGATLESYIALEVDGGDGGTERQWFKTSDPVLDLSAFMQFSDMQEITAAEIDAITDI